MRFGMCADLLDAPAVAEAGFDYIEGAMTQVALATEPEFEKLAEAVARSGLPVEALNRMLPGTFRLTGPLADLRPVKAYLEVGFARAEALGVKVQGFGCSGARNYPQDWPKNKALAQLGQFLGLAAPLAASHGIYIAVEGLNTLECNIINNVSEAAVLAKLALRFNVGVMADWYHMALEKEDGTGIADEKKMLLHCHIANPEGRRFPLSGDGADYSPFTKVLKNIKYGGRVSVEGEGGPEEYAACLQRLRELFL